MTRAGVLTTVTSVVIYLALTAAIFAALGAVQKWVERL
nr:potassium-transporting ATPase [Mycobacterium sp. NAZ190054]